MKHILAILLIAACAYSIHVRRDNFREARSGAARGHAAKIAEIKAELERQGGSDEHLAMADQSMRFILWQREDWHSKTQDYATLSNVLIGLTLIYLVASYRPRKRKSTEQETGGDS